MKRPVSLGIFLSMVLLLGTVGCTRQGRKPTPDEDKRGVDQSFAPGTADNLYNVNKFQVIDIPSDQLPQDLLESKSIRIKTSAEGEPAKVSISTAGTLIDSESGISFVNEYQFLDYEFVDVQTEDQKLLTELVGRVERFKGFPNTEYIIVPHLQDNYLIFYRLSARDKVPYDELPIALNVGEMVATPLVGYPVDYCVAEKVLNTNHEETGLNRPKCTGVSLEDAGYVSFQRNRKQVFEYQPKVDIFPRDFFNGKWFFVKTDIRTSHDMTTGFHLDFESAKLVELENTVDSLKIKDADGYEIEEKDKVTSFAIPVEWKSYEIARDSNIIHTFAERENQSGKDIDRPYFRIKFQDLAQSEAIGSGVVAVETESVVVTDSYFSFIVSVSGKRNRWVKYAFNREPDFSSYKEKQWMKEDSTLFFPVFSDVRRYYRTAEEHTQEHREKFTRITRFNPQAQEGTVQVIKWYFSKQTPKDDWLRSFGRKAVEYWDRAFQSAGKGSGYEIRVVLDESADKELGDIRYNIINLMVSKEQQASLLGFGPNISHPMTGEVLSATANVWITNVINNYTQDINKYIRLSIYPPSYKLFPSAVGVSQFMDEKITKLCPEVIKFIENERAKGLIFHPVESTLDDTELIRECSKKMSYATILMALEHEMGHGFGLRHVFSSSVDKDNFYTDYDEVKQIFGDDIIMDDTESYREPAQYSSVMDYADFQYPVLTVPGKYDIAAIRFVYFDRVELEGGDLLHVPVKVDSASNSSQKSIQDTALAQNATVKKYNVCGGRREGGRTDFNLDDPLCEVFDYGSTPLEVVENAIRRLKNNLLLHRYRYDSTGISAVIGKSTLDRIVSVHKKWIEYRDLLLNSINKSVWDYSPFDEEALAEYKALIKESADRDPEFKAYSEIREPLFAFYKQLLYLPVKHCVYKKDGNYKAMPFLMIGQQLRNQYGEGSREIFMNCQSPVVVSWAQENNMGEFITEVGITATTRSYFLGANSEDFADEMSLLTGVNMQGQKYVSWLSYALHTMNAVVLEPDFLKELTDEQVKYMLEGQDFNPYLNDDMELPRFVTHYIDSVLLSGGGGYPLGLLSFRSIPGNIYMTLLRQNSNNLQVINSLLETMGKWPISRQALIDFVGKQEPSSYKQISASFVADAYQQYIDEGVDQIETSFVDFIFAHPFLCILEGEVGIVMPYSISDNNVITRYCERVNEYEECLRGPSCENRADKEVFIKYVFQ